MGNFTFNTELSESILRFERARLHLVRVKRETTQREVELANAMNELGKRLHLDKHESMTLPVADGLLLVRKAKSPADQSYIAEWLEPMSAMAAANCGF